MIFRSPHFLDFSTLSQRKQACAEEVRLNRRLAPEIYLGVAAITGSPEAPHISGTCINPENEAGIFVGACPVRDKGVRVQGTLLQLSHPKGELRPNEPIEYAVKMRQFPPDATLDRLDERGELGINRSTHSPRGWRNFISRNAPARPLPARGASRTTSPNRSRKTSNCFSPSLMMRRISNA